MNEYEPEYLQKAEKYKPDKHKHLLPGRWIQEKYDGYGSQVIFHNGDVEIYAMSIAEKSGEFSNFSKKLPHLIDELETIDFDGKIQGELYTDHLPPGNKSWGFVSGILQSDTALKRQIEHKIKFVAYEVPSSNKPYYKRYDILRDLFQKPFTYSSLAPILAVNDAHNEALDFYFDQMISAGKEGLVLYDPQCMYKHSQTACQRNKGLLKIKAENEREVLCVKKIEGNITEKGGKFVGTLGSMDCVDSKGKTFNIGSFLITNKERDYIWNNLEEPFLVEMIYFEETEDSYKTPRLKRVRPDKSLADWNKID